MQSNFDFFFQRLKRKNLFNSTLLLLLLLTMTKMSGDLNKSSNLCFKVQIKKKITIYTIILVTFNYKYLVMELK